MGGRADGRQGVKDRQGSDKADKRRDKAGGTAERMDKRADGRNRRGQDEWADGRTGGRAERQTKQTERRNGQNGRSGRIGGQMGGRSGGRSGRKGKQSGRTAETPHRHSEDSQNAGLNHAAGEEKTTIRPGETGRERKPGADRTGADQPKRRYGISGRLFRYVRRH